MSTPQLTPVIAAPDSCRARCWTPRHAPWRELTDEAGQEPAGVGVADPVQRRPRLIALGERRAHPCVLAVRCFGRRAENGVEFVLEGAAVAQPSDRVGTRARAPRARVRVAVARARATDPAAAVREGDQHPLVLADRACAGVDAGLAVAGLADRAERPTRADGSISLAQRAPGGWARPATRTRVQGRWLAARRARPGGGDVGALAARAPLVGGPGLSAHAAGTGVAAGGEHALAPEADPPTRHRPSQRPHTSTAQAGRRLHPGDSGTRKKRDQCLGRTRRVGGPADQGIGMQAKVVADPGPGGRCHAGDDPGRFPGR